MLRGDRAEWEALCAVLEARPDEALHDPESPDWTARDVYAHLARWMERSTSEFEGWLATGTLLPKLEGSDDEINARWQAEDGGMTLDEARERAQAAFDRRIAAIASVPAERWDAVAEACARADGAEHFGNHRRYIAR